MMNYIIGSTLSVVIDNADSRAKMAPCSMHRVSARQSITGTVVQKPTWLQGPHLCLINSQTKALNLIPEHRILEVDNVALPRGPVLHDLVYNVESSKKGYFYTVIFSRLTKTWSCTCTGWQYHKRCRHVHDSELVAEKLR